VPYTGAERFVGRECIDVSDTPTDSDPGQLLETYRNTLLQMHEERALDRGATRWNRLLKKMQRIHLELRATHTGRRGISDLIEDDCITVRLWSATHALEWDRTRARAELERLAGGSDDNLYAFDAQMTLREFDAGSLRTDWRP
jgi:hypothetical protein